MQSESSVIGEFVLGLAEPAEVSEPVAQAVLLREGGEACVPVGKKSGPGPGR